MIAKTLKTLTAAALLSTLVLVPTAAAQEIPLLGPYDDCISRPVTEELVCTVFVFIGLTLEDVQELCEDVSPDCNVTAPLKFLS